MMVLLVILTPLLMAAMVATLPESRARGTALLGACMQTAAILAMAFMFPWKFGQTDQFTSISDQGDPSWISSLGVNISFGVDTVSMLMLLLTGLLGPLCVLASYSAITERVRTYYSWLLVLQAAMVGVFVARDVVLFYVFFEFTLIPLYILINMYGSTNRKAAATKFFLYTFTGSLFTLAGFVYVAWVNAKAGTGVWTFDFHTLALTARGMSFSQQAWVFWAMLAGFAVKVPLFPVHTWLPQAHTEAPTAGSVILAGVLLKLGTYGIFKFVLGMVPAAAIFYAPTMAVLAIIGIVYAGLICWVQTDIKKLVAYSSVSHLGYCVLGLFALNSIGITGSILYMINHGLSTGALFLLIGMMYERYHTRSLNEVGGLASKMPIWSTFMVFFAMASVGLPGLNGFVSEMMCILGAFQASGAGWAQFGAAAGGVGGHGGLPIGATPGHLGPWFAFAAGIGVIVTAMYLLLMLGKICFGPLREPAGHAAHGHDTHANDGHLPTDLNRREIGTLLPLAVLCLALGVYPRPLLQVLEKPVDAVVGVLELSRRVPPMGYPESLRADLKHHSSNGPGGAGAMKEPSTIVPPHGSGTEKGGH